MHLLPRASLLALMLAALSSCHNQRISVDNIYVSERSLSSYYVGTPDPNLCCPQTGEVLIIRWRLPRTYLYENDPHFLLTVRYGNRCERSFMFPIDHFRGSFTYKLLNEDYWNWDGITTYKVEFFADNKLLEAWYHQVWVELITVDACKNDHHEDACPFSLD